MMIRHLARNGNIVITDNNDNEFNNEEQIIDEEQKVVTSNEDNMDDRFDDILKVNRNDTSSEIYKKYEEIKSKMDAEDDSTQENYNLDEETKQNAFLNHNASFYSLLKTPEKEEQPKEEVSENIEKEKDTDPNILHGDPKVMFDLFNLNRESKESDEANIIQEKKLVNTGKKNVFNEKNEAETVDENQEPVYAFQKTDTEINYQNAFRNLRQTEPKKHSKGKFDNTFSNNAPVTTVDLKNKIYAAGYKLRTYQKVESDSYYTNRYYLSNKLNFDCSIITAIIMMFIVGIMWLAFDSYVKLPIYVYIGMMAGFLILPIFTGINNIINPKVRKPANFSFLLAILNAIMVYLLGLVICILVAFLALGVDLENMSTFVCPVIYPLLYMLVIPCYVLIYQLLYASKKYNIE